MTDEWPEYSQGVCADGAAILENGVTLTIDEIVNTLNNQVETVRCQQLVLDQIAQALGLETGDVDGIGREIERLKKDAERYRWLRDESGDGVGEACEIYDINYEIQGLKQGPELDEAIDKALAAGEAG